MKLDKKLALITGIPFGIFAGGLAGFVFGKGIIIGILVGIMSGLLFGVSISIILEALSQGVSKKAGPAQSKTVTIDLPYETALAKSVQALDTIKAKVTHKEEANGIIRAKTSINWKSWGEAIEIRLAKQEDGKVMMTVSSRPKLRTTLVDYGKGLENVTSIVDVMSS